MKFCNLYTVGVGFLFSPQVEAEPQHTEVEPSGRIFYPPECNFGEILIAGYLATLKTTFYKSIYSLNVLPAKVNLCLKRQKYVNIIVNKYIYNIGLIHFTFIELLKYFYVLVLYIHIVHFIYKCVKASSHKEQ